MSIPYFPLYPTDFDGKTAHLSLAEDGAYNRLLRLQWTAPGGKLPADLPWIMRKMRAVTEADQAVVVTVIGEFFTRKGGKIFSDRLLKEWVKANDSHERRILAGSRGGNAKALKNKDYEPSNAQAMLKQPEPEPDIEKREAKASPKKRGSRLPDGWFLPLTWGQWAVAEGYSSDTIRTEAENFKDYWHSKAGPTASKLDWEATWRIWVRKAPKGKQNGKHDGAAFGAAIHQLADRIAEGTARIDTSNRDPFAVIRGSNVEEDADRSKRLL